jgi:predicted RND superfamily exporter protein
MYRSLARASLILVLLLTAFFFWGGAALRFNYNFEDFFPADDADVTFYNTFKNTFGQDNDFLLTSFTPKKGIFKANFWRKIQHLQDSLAAQPEVLSTQSALDVQLPYRGPFSLLTRPLLNINEDTKLLKDSIFIQQQEDLRGSFFSEDLRSTILVLHTKALKKP